MSYDDLLKTSLWNRYSKKMISKIESPRNGGSFKEEDANERGMRLVIGSEGSLEEGSALAFYWFVDPMDGVIVDAKFQVFGPSALIAAAEVACEFLISKSYDQARRMSAELLDKQLRDKPDQVAFPDELVEYLNLVIDAVDNAVEQCLDIPLSKQYTTPIPNEPLPEGYPGWSQLSDKEKYAVVEKLLDEQIRPYIELDAGGIQIAKLEEKTLTISYQGACTSCLSAIGTTLSAIQQIIQTKIHPDIVVIPDMEGLEL
ncbi:MAG: iron-sulfur cluster assembly scaffold protein [Chlamydiales bacterium]